MLECEALRADRLDEGEKSRDGDGGTGELGEKRPNPTLDEGTSCSASCDVDAAAGASDTNEPLRPDAASPLRARFIESSWLRMCRWRSA